MDNEGRKYALLASRQETADNTWTKNEKRRWLLTLFTGTSAVYASRTVVPLLVPAIAKECGWSKTDSGTVLSSFFWGYTLTQVIGGYLSDRLGGQKILFVAAIGWSTITFVMPQMIWVFADTDAAVKFIVLVRVLHGAFQGVHFPSMSSLTSQQIAEKERAAFFSVLTSGSAVGTLMTGMLGSYLLDQFGWPTVFYFVGFMGIMWMFLLHYQIMALDKRKNIVSISHRLHSSNSKEKLPVPWIVLFQKMQFWSCIIGHACQNNCFFLLLSWLPTYFNETFPDAKGWIVNMVPWLCCIPCTFLGNWLTEKLISKGYTTTTTRKVIEVLCLGLQALGLLLIPLFENYYWSLAWVTVAVSATGFHNSAILVNPQDLAPQHSGSVFGIMNTVGAIPGFTGVYLAGYILETTKQWSAVFQATAAINIFGCILFVWFGSAEPII